MIANLIAAYRRWAAAQDERIRLIDLGAQIAAENRSPETYEERRAVAAHNKWMATQW